MLFQQGRRHEVFIGEGVGFMGKQAHLPKMSFSSYFGHFILKMLEKHCNFFKSINKNAEMSSVLGGRPPLISRLGGGDASSFPRFRRPCTYFGVGIFWCT